MMNNIAQLRVLTGSLLVAFLLLTSCSKEDLVKPLHQQDNPDVVTKYMIISTSDTSDKQVLNSRDNSTGEGDCNGDSGISDDGDDLSGSEGRKAK